MVEISGKRNALDALKSSVKRLGVAGVLGIVAVVFLYTACTARVLPNEMGVEQKKFGFKVDRIVPMGERHLRSVVSEYMEHYHGERNHQGLENRLINAMAVNDNGRVRRRERLGGLLNFYYREAA